MPHRLLLSLLMAVSMPAMAVYKCTSHDHVIYTDVPCGAGQVSLPPAPLPLDAEGARQQAARERKELVALEKNHDAERVAREREHRLHKDDKAAMAHRKKCTLLGLERKWSAEDAAAMSKTVSEKTQGLKKTARRKAERYDAECGGRL